MACGQTEVPRLERRVRPTAQGQYWQGHALPTVPEWFSIDFAKAEMIRANLRNINFLRLFCIFSCVAAGLSL
jgi:hypothetical protein